MKIRDKKAHENRPFLTTGKISQVSQIRRNKASKADKANKAK